MNTVLTLDDFDIIYMPYKLQAHNGDLDFFLRKNGVTYFIWAITPQAIISQMDKDGKSGESNYGSYLWILGMIIVKEINLEVISKAISDLVKEDPEWIQNNLKEVFLSEA